MLLVLTPVVSALVAPLGGWLSDRMSPAHLSTAAIAATVAVLYALSRLDGQSNVIGVGVRMGLLGIGFGVFQAANANLVMGSVSADRLVDHGAARMGAVVSVAVLSAVFAARLAAYGGDDNAFAQAFRDTYTIANAIAAAALPISMLCWPARNRVSWTDQLLERAGDRLGMGGSIMALSRSLGAVVSVAVLSAVFAARLAAYGRRR